MTDIKTIRRAMLLAAGLGTRLIPMTYEKPKPLFTVGGHPIIDYNLRLLKNGGIEDVIINLHHLGEMIKNHIGDGMKYGMRIEYSFEPEILGTGGGVKKVEKFFGGKPFIVLNSDILIDIDLKDLIKRHLEGGAVATMVVKQIEKTEDFTPIEVRNGLVKSIGKKGRHIFTGLQVLSPEFLSILPESGFSCIVKDGYIKAIEKGIKVSAYEHKGFWADIGTIDRYEAVKRLNHSYFFPRFAESK